MRKSEKYTITVQTPDGTVTQFRSVRDFQAALKSGSFETMDLTIEGLIRIPDYLCESRPEIRSLTLGEGVHSVGMGAFMGCVNIRSIHFAGTVAGLGDYAFARNYGLREIVCGRGMRYIGKGAFFGCTGLCSITLEKTLRDIGPLAFAYCRNLHNISAHLTSACVIHKSAFHCSLNDCVVCSQLGRLALKDLPDRNAFTPGTAQNRYYVEKKNGWEKERLKRQLAYRRIDVKSIVGSRGKKG